VMDVAVSSYTPTLETLLKPSMFPIPGDGGPNILIVSQPETLDQQRIPGTEREGSIVQSIFP
jgi:hypothetical protein